MNRSFKRTLQSICAVTAIAFAGAAFAEPDQGMQNGMTGTGTQGSMGNGMSGSQGSPGMQQGMNGDMGQAGGDTKLLSQLHQTNLTEIQEGELAQSNAKSSKVKSYGKELVKDHQKADKLVMAQAKKLGFDLTTAATAGQSDGQQEIAQLRGLQGDDFDRQFLQDEVQGHQKAIDMVKSAQASAQDKDVKKTLKKILPKLEDHLKMAQKLEKKIGGPQTGER
ncbi:MAG: DUF4142 domain-containing protein [Deltaproteobacteria bacterium]